MRLPWTEDAADAAHYGCRALLRGSTSHISRVQDARDELAKAWLIELVERTPVSELGEIGIEWLSQEAPALIASVLGALADPGSAADRELSASELRRAASSAGFAAGRHRQRGCRVTSRPCTGSSDRGPAA